MVLIECLCKGVRGTAGQSHSAGNRVAGHTGSTVRKYSDSDCVETTEGCCIVNAANTQFRNKARTGHGIGLENQYALVLRTGGLASCFLLRRKAFLLLHTWKE